MNTVVNVLLFALLLVLGIVFTAVFVVVMVLTLFCPDVVEDKKDLPSLSQTIHSIPTWYVVTAKDRKAVTEKEAMALKKLGVNVVKE